MKSQKRQKEMVSRASKSSQQEKVSIKETEHFLLQITILFANYQDGILKYNCIWSLKSYSCVRLLSWAK